MSELVRSLHDRFRETLKETGPGDRLVVAISGGLDSTVLLHLCRFAGSRARSEVVAAHFDHRMRPSSAGDARWVSGLCKAWGVRLRTGEADRPLESEASARTARYAFLESVMASEGAGARLLTAHHADDQAETVLFRALRGAGSRGLSGIPAERSPSIHRPLLGFWRSELERYARDVGLSWREDPTNADATFARNALRRRILPEVERLVAPGARRALVRLAGAAAEEEGAWASVLPELMRPLEVSRVEGGVSFRRAPFLRFHRAVRMRVLRSLSGELGVSLDRSAALRASGFAEDGTSGKAVDLGGEVRLAVDLDRLILARSVVEVVDRPLTIDDTGPGRGTAVLAGSVVPVTWGGGVLSHRDTRCFDPDALRFPLVVRSRRPGDRIRLAGGTKKVKKVLLEHRVPLSTRPRVALLVDAEGDVLWIPGLAGAAGVGPSDAHDALRIGVG